MPAAAKTAEAPALEMTAVMKRFGRTVALDGVDLEVREGEVLALIGENGAGKSTLMKALSGAVRPDGGEMRLFGQPYQPHSPIDGRSRGVAMIYQELSLAAHLSVAENILLGAEPQRAGLLDRRSLRAQARAALARLGRADIPLGRRAGRLSAADQQIVEIARAIRLGCRVLIFDEPTSSLTRPDIERLFELIRALRDDGCAIIYISHALEEVEAVCDRYTVLRDGRCVGGGQIEDFSGPEVIRLMVGRDVDALYPRSAANPGEAVLEASQLQGRPLPRSASLTLHRGEVVGIFGLIGAGRTEFIRALFGLAPIASGSVRALGLEGAATPRVRWRSGAGIISESRKIDGLALEMSVAENICLPRLDRVGRFGLAPRSASARAAAPGVERLGIRCASARQRAGALSGGNQQKVAMARLLQCDVDLLLLDEPTRGVDVGAKASIYAIIDRLARGEEGGRARAALIVSSYLPELLGVCDRIAVMRRGVLGPARPVEQVSERSLMAEATGAEAAA